ncbi:hypothetical protein [Rhizobium leguminosarum]
MTFWQRYSPNGVTRAIAIIVIVTLTAASIGLFLASCQTYQPPGEDLWLAL